jgi:hypothetical protein
MVLRRFLVFSCMALALVVLSPAGAGAANAIRRPILGIAKGTTTVNLTTGAGTTVNDGYLLGIGLFNASSSSTFAYTGPNTFSGTGTGSLVTANGNELFVTTAVTGTLNGSAVTARTVDTITGGTGRFVGASGQINISARGTSASTAGSTETFTTLGIWTGTISHPVVSLTDISSSSVSGTQTYASISGCAFTYETFDAVYPGSSAVGNITLQIAGCVDAFPSTAPSQYTGSFTITTGVGTLSGSASGLVSLQLPNVVAQITLSVNAGSGSFTGTTESLLFSATIPLVSDLSFVASVTVL